ncbi:PBECR4 domain-containing protein [Carnobacterium sp.]|uniref:PBECR4 domain-containing protein n=1 Tax=Carnobacterium sp. TaxID=48221 RepID=UPI002FC9B591
MDTIDLGDCTKPIEINCYADINFKALLDDYRHHFSRKLLIVETNYKALAEFSIVFNEKDLPHLMGWDKIMGKKKSAKFICGLIDKNQLTVESSKKHSRFNEAKKRMLNYNFIHDCFLHNTQNVCVMTKSMKPNPLNLDIVFYREGKREAVVLGLRKDLKSGLYVPTTLHNKNINCEYNRRARTKVNKTYWKL